MKKKMCEINGIRYTIPKVFAECCGWTTQKVRAACISNNWMIPCDAVKPLELETIR